MEPLIEIPRDKWPELRDLYLSNWPDGAEAYCLLNIQITHPHLGQEFNFHVYCPEGNLSNGMIATFDKDSYYQVIIQPIGENTAKIEESLLTTNIINWNRFIAVPNANDVTIQCLERVKERLGINLWYGGRSKAYKHFLDKSSKKFDDLVTPPNTYIGPLRPEHIDLVNETWTYKSDYSSKIFETLMNNGLSYVLYSKIEAEDSGIKREEKSEGDNHNEETKKEAEENKDAAKANPKLNEKESDIIKPLKGNSDEPLAWLSVGESGALSHLFCSEKHRRKGYSEILTKYVINELLSKGHDAIAYTLEDNTNPKNLFRKLGFKDIGYDHWVMIQKITKK